MLALIRLALSINIAMSAYILYTAVFKVSAPFGILFFIVSWVVINVASLLLYIYFEVRYENSVQRKNRR